MLLDVVRSNSPFQPYVNTGTLFDLATGKFRQGTDNKWVLDGGFSPCNGIAGRAQTFKSSLAMSFLCGAMNIYKNAECYAYETENAYSAERFNEFVPSDSPISDRIVFKNSTTCSLSDFYEEYAKIADEKLKHAKDYMVESPFLDVKTGKPYKIWVPTFFLIDSFSRARSDKGDQQYDDNAIDSSGMNTLWLSEGNIKTRIMNDLPNRAAKVGLYVILTAHVGNKQDLDPYNRSPKQLQYMKNIDKMKNVGSNFEFLVTSLLQTIKAEVMQDSNKQCEFPNQYSTAVDVNRVDTVMVRCKNNSSGVQIPFVVSQYQGILNSVTNFVFLKTNKYYGIEVTGNNTGFTPSIYPAGSFTRKNLRDLSDKDYALYRALELTTQLCFIQRFWNTSRAPEYVHIPITDFADKLKGNGQLADRILQSTGCWSTSKQDRERLTIMDILALIHQA